jgi:hypothetical protein
MFFGATKKEKKKKTKSSVYLPSWASTIILQQTFPIPRLPCRNPIQRIDFGKRLESLSWGFSYFQLTPDVAEWDLGPPQLNGCLLRSFLKGSSGPKCMVKFY